jgi:cell division septal protein FtsQ
LSGHLFALESVAFKIADISVEGNLHTTQNGNILRVCDRRSSLQVASSG